MTMTPEHIHSFTDLMVFLSQLEAENKRLKAENDRLKSIEEFPAVRDSKTGLLRRTR